MSKNNKLLLHSCCAPCSIYPLSEIKKNGFDTTLFFNNPNIHPFKEFKKRMNTFKNYCKQEKHPFIINSEYGLKNFLRSVVFKEQERCQICYLMRLEVVVDKAKELNFDHFSTTLLYSKYQNHNLIIKICENLAEKKNINFFYDDFRVGWQDGVNKSKELGLYRQPYCGCIFSEQERYDKSLN